MLSVIVCSRNKTLFKEFSENISKTIGVEYEIIDIDNSDNKHSIFSAYNLGVSKSKYPYLCLVHEDVLFHSDNWGKNVIAHLQDPKTGILGVAGGDMVTRIPASWPTSVSLSVNIIQTDYSPRKRPTKFLLEPENYTLSKRSSVTLDGIFLCMRKELMHKIHFDENLKGFHGYDYDISIQSAIAGYANYVIFDVKLEHFSRGKTNILYFRNLIHIFKKWETYLPLNGDTITEKELNDIKQIEFKMLKQLTKKMIRKGFESKEIISETTYYANKIESTDATKNIKMRIFLTRLFNSPEYLFRG